MTNQTSPEFREVCFLLTLDMLLTLIGDNVLVLQKETTFFDRFGFQTSDLGGRRVTY